MSDRTAETAGAVAENRAVLSRILTSTGPLLALVLLMLIGLLMSDSFLTYENLTNVFTRSAIIGIIAIGATFVITAGASIFRSVRCRR